MCESSSKPSGHLRNEYHIPERGMCVVHHKAHLQCVQSLCVESSVSSDKNYLIVFDLVSGKIYKGRLFGRTTILYISFITSAVLTLQLIIFISPFYYPF